MTNLRRCRAALIVAPHPDDETIGAHALIGALRRRGARVRVVVASDGAASHAASRVWARARLVAERRREVRIAMARRGVTAAGIRFLALPDGGLSRVQDRLDHALAREVRRMRELDLLVGPSPLDDHPDHRAVAAALARAHGGGRRLSYRVWPAGRRGRRAQVCVRGCGLGKRRAIRRYRTQAGLITDDPRGFAMSVHEIARFAHGVERFEVERRCGRSR